MFWHRGDFIPIIDSERGPLNDELVENAFKILTEFIQVCQRNYFAYAYARRGFINVHAQHKEMFPHASMTNFMWIGTDDPNDPKQVQGMSTIGKISQAELLNRLRQSGEFENLIAKSFIVSVYHSWNDAYRPEIAKTLSINTDAIKCSLMGDLRLIRNLIIHEGSIVPTGFSRKLEFLPEIWNILPGNLTISHDMLHLLMEQLNAIQLTIAPPQPSN